MFARCFVDAPRFNGSGLDNALLSATVISAV
jgi:hypothetical protein